MRRRSKDISARQSRYARSDGGRLGPGGEGLDLRHVEPGIAEENRRVPIEGVVAVMAAAMGVAYWAWTLVYDVLKEPLLKPLGIKRGLDGFWLLAPVFFGYMVRKPSIALFGSLVAAGVEGIITQWGMSALVYGLLQGLGAELVFMLFLYRKWNFSVLMLAASMAAIFSFGYDFFSQEQENLSVAFNTLQLLIFVVSSWIFAAGLSRFLGKRLLKTGLLDGFLIAQDR